jgi:hypothetical protein
LKNNFYFQNVTGTVSTLIIQSAPQDQLLLKVIKLFEKQKQMSSNGLTRMNSLPSRFQLNGETKIAPFLMMPKPTTVHGGHFNEPHYLVNISYY